MHKNLLAVITLTGLTLALPATAYAAGDQLHQKILPLNCVFEEVNDGLGSLYYLTPQECGVVVPPLQSVPQPSQGGQVFVRTPQLQSYNPAQPFVGSLNVRAVLPWQPIVAVVRGDGSVVVGAQSDGQPTSSTNLIDAVGHLLGDILHPTPLKIAVGVTAAAFIAIVLFLALI